MIINAICLTNYIFNNKMHYPTKWFIDLNKLTHSRIFTIMRLSYNKKALNFCILQLILCLNVIAQTDTRISRIDFTGNDFYSSNNILEMMNQKQGLIYSPKQLELDLQNIIKNYQQAGFLNFTISKKKHCHN